jgi:hypothetical protein
MIIARFITHLLGRFLNELSGSAAVHKKSPRAFIENPFRMV